MQGFAGSRDESRYRSPEGVRVAARCAAREASCQIHALDRVLDLDSAAAAADVKRAGDGSTSWPRRP